jgi:TRAP-type C4-dicarboxylate transport system permease small subunit
MPNMSESKDPIKAVDPTPEPLMKLLDLQIAAQRAKRKETPGRRTTMIAVALVVIIAGALLAFLILQQMVADLPPPGTSDGTSTVTQ